MTLIIGIKCSDGIVLGADSAATIQAANNLPTITQPVKKIDTIYNYIAIGFSGAIAINQLLVPEIKNAWDKDLFKDLEKHKIQLKIQEICRLVLQEQWTTAKNAAQCYGQNAINTMIFQMLVGIWSKGSFHLFNIDPKCSVEEVTENLPFASIGCGQSIADPFLGFIRRIFWDNSLPSVIEGIFATLWALSHSISITPGGIADPVNIYILSKNKNEPIIKKLEDFELQETQEAISSAEKSLKHYKEFSLSENSLKNIEIPKP